MSTSAEVPFVPVTVSQLLGNPTLGLTRHARAAAVDRPISWVHVSELADPTPFLEGGELLLTTGLALEPGPALADYVRRLADAGVVGLGLGTGLGHETVPAELRSEEHMSELQSRQYLVCRLLLGKKPLTL